MPIFNARTIGWIVGVGALAMSQVASANPYRAQMEAVVRIGSEQIDLRLVSGLELIEEARAGAIATLETADSLSLAPDTLRIAEYDAKNSVRGAAELALADLRGMATNTVVTLENFGASPHQIMTIMDLWDRRSDALELAIEDALDDIEEATPASTALSDRLVISVSHSPVMLAEAQRVFEGLAMSFDAELRSSTDEVVRTLRVAKTTSMHPRAERKLFRQASRDAKRAGKDMIKALKDQFKAYKRAAQSRDEKKALKTMYKEARQALKDAIDDARVDIDVAR